MLVMLSNLMLTCVSSQGKVMLGKGGKLRLG
jgi:hypothetical protein